jgi:hypothetical protein
MVRGRRAEATVSHSDVSFRLNQKTANFKATIPRRTMQWSKLAEEKRKNQFAQTEFPKVSLHQNNKNDNGRQLLFVLCVHISVARRGEENLLPFGYEWYCVVLYLVLGLGLQYLLYFVLYT